MERFYEVMGGRGKIFIGVKLKATLDSKWKSRLCRASNTFGEQIILA